ncbi:hypothetical protein P153DRAFT_356520 [Dothidotthia symphoricarpi CBS 119687]|uniref:Uncharacterized protein n=1 Tax=Dothidotthia symphoricarpi CBS 119687 TaxID=1392245 RepID=A0A6A6AFM1_9PLEO|nr:uncharacterized protein P153DRAFT_356520 [Dothidotthia symphoricarpi CBS 119687]KAF2129838.1 hypothetical protein P153DRAFT_356520 [Dothidotthia symphoricarpi CBS 119687]
MPSKRKARGSNQTDSSPRKHERLTENAAEYYKSSRPRVPSKLVDEKPDYLNADQQDRITANKTSNPSRVANKYRLPGTRGKYQSAGERAYVPGPASQIVPRSRRQLRMEAAANIALGAPNAFDVYITQLVYDEMIAQLPAPININTTRKTLVNQVDVDRAFGTLKQEEKMHKQLTFNCVASGIMRNDQYESVRRS